jgi:RNA polymerase sigma factor (sigma-70 family)
LGSRRPSHECRDLVVDVIGYLVVGMRQTKGGLSRSGFSPLQKWLANPQGSLVGFCLTSARNYLIDLSRQKGISTGPLTDRGTTDSPRPADLSTPAPQEDDLFAKELKRAVQDIYGRLPPHDRNILMLKYHLEMTDAQIGQELGVSETMARKRRNNAEEKFLSLFVSKYAHIAQANC